MSLSTDTTMQVVPAGYQGNCGGGGMWGGDWSAWIVLFLIFGIFGGWGAGGWGGNWGGFGGGTPVQQGYDTRADIQRSFDNSAVVTKLDGITQGICDSTYALNNAITGGFNSVNTNLMQGFNGVERSMCGLQAKISDCCCQTQRAIDGVNYNLATQACDTRNLIQSSVCGLQNTMNNNTRDIIDNQNQNSRAILDFLTQDKIATLQAENQSLKFQASQSAQNAFITANQEAQTAELIRRLGKDCPAPAFIVPNPNCCYNYNVQGVGYGNGGCCNGACA